MDLIEDRRATRRENGIGYCRHGMFILTDGMPAAAAPLPVALRRIRETENAQGATTFAILSGDARYQIPTIRTP